MQRIFERLNKVLAAHGARHIGYDYDGQGKATSITFAVETPRGRQHIRLPARIDRVAAVMARQKADGWRNPDQVYRTAWKNIHDWVDAQMALLETEMVKLEELFLPYMIDSQGRTFFEVIEQRGYSLGPGVQKEAHE